MENWFMKKSLSLLLIGSLSLWLPCRADDELLLAVNTNFKPARPAGATEESKPQPQTPAKPAPTPPPAPVATAPAPTPPPPAPVETPPPAPDSTPVLTDANRAEIEQLAQEELVRREEAHLTALQLIKDAQALYRENKLAAAAEKFEAALKTLPTGKATEAARTEAQEGLARCYYRLAEDALAANDIAKARGFAQKTAAVSPGSRQTQSILARVERAQRLADRPEPPPDPSRTPEFLGKREEIKKLFREGKILLNSGQFDQAERAFQQILVIDPYNTDAYILLDELNRQRVAFAKVGTDRSRSQRLWEVGRGWLPPLSVDVKRAAEDRPDATSKESRAKTEMIKRVNEIIIEEINFRDAVITDVINFLSSESRKIDPPGVNIVLQLGESAAPAAAPMEVPPVGPEGAPALPAQPDAAASVPRISVQLRKIPLIDALRLITQAANLKFRVEPFAVVVLPKNAPEEDLVTRSYPVEAGVIRTLVSAPEASQERGGGEEFVGLAGSGATTELTDVKKLFSDAGVPFPPGSSIIFNERSSRIILRNTPANIEIFEEVLAGFNIVPVQVEIEAKFVEISQADLDELGFDWKVGQRIFGSFDTFGGGNIPFGSAPDLSLGEGNISPGLRDSTVIKGNAIDSLLGLGGAGTRPDLATLRGVLTNPQFEVIVRALAQKKSTDLLSAPRITTISGNAAQIRVVQEFIYPTEFEPPQVSDNVVSPFTPSGFKTREVGVLLNVTPQVGADGYTINLTLIPEVSEFLGFIDYSPGDTVFRQGGGTGDTVRVENKIQQPLFASRNLTTSVVVWDGQTVVLGGLMREDINKIEDKIPFLGDIPFIGRLFRSKVDSRSKRNLLIFVTANLIDPAGNKVHKQEAVTLR